MLNVIILFERPDISAVNYLQTQFQDSEVWVFDPHLLDDLEKENIQSCKYVNYKLNVNHVQFFNLMREEALLIESEINAILNAEDKVSNIYNLHTLNWETLQTNLNGYTQLWNQFLENDLSNYTFHLPIYDRAGNYYLPSFIPGLILFEKMNQKGLHVKAYSHSTMAEESRRLPILSDNQNINEFRIFLHLPTCFHDADHFQNELLSSNNKSINFPSQDWGTNLSLLETAILQEDHLVIGKFDSKLQLEISKKINLIEPIIYNHFKKYFSAESFLIRQVKNMSIRYKASLIFINYLDKLCAKSLPDAIVLSSHDAGLHSAFYHIAQKYNIHTIVLPHSKSINWPIESNSTNRILALTHSIQTTSVVNIHKKDIFVAKIIYPADSKILFKKSLSLKTIGIVLNKFSNDGISFVNTDDYLSNLREVIKWAKKNNILIRFRLKPGGTCIKWLSINLNLSPSILIECLSMSISDFATETDLCILYDAPTSGAIEILSVGIPLIGIKFRELVITESSIVCNELVPYMTTKDGLQLLNKFSNSKESLDDFRCAQAINYIDRIRSSTSISSHLNCIR